MFSSLSAVRLVLRISPHLNILCISLEKPRYTEHTNYLRMAFNYFTQYPRNRQSTLIMNISRSTSIQHVLSILSTRNTTAALLAVSLVPLYCVLTYRTHYNRNRTCFRWSTLSLDDTILIAKLFRVRN